MPNRKRSNAKASEKAQKRLAPGSGARTSHKKGNALVNKWVESLRTRMPDLQTRYGVRSLSVFGSFVRGDQKRGSDLDVLVEFEPNQKVTLLDFVRLENELSDLLGVKVDIVERAGLKPRIGRRVLQEAIPV